MEFKNIFERYASQVNALQVPGLPGNLIAIFTGKDTDLKVYTQIPCSMFDGDEFNEYINRFLIPWAFTNGIYCSGMWHGSWAVERSYAKASDVIMNADDDYSVNATILNYVFACIAEIYARCQKNKGGITMIAYWAEADQSVVEEFPNEDAFTARIKEDLEYLEDRADDGEA